MYMIRTSSEGQSALNEGSRLTILRCNLTPDVRVKPHVVCFSADILSGGLTPHSLSVEVFSRLCAPEERQLAPIDCESPAGLRF